MSNHRGRADHPAPWPRLVRGHRQPKNEGTKLFQLSGHVNTPCVVEESMGISFRELIEPPWRRHSRRQERTISLLAVIPGGSSVPLLPAERDPRCADGLRRAEALGSGLGTAAVIVMDKSTDMVSAIGRICYFYKHESCGQCTPCREGTGWMWRMMERIARATPSSPRSTADRRHQAGRGPHHLRARRRRRLADPGPDPPLPPRLERRIAERTARGMLEAAE